MGCKQCKILFTKPVKSTVNFTNIQPTRTSSEIVTVQPTNSSSLSSLTFENLPVELIHHILDRLDTDTIFSSLYNVSPHLNSILRTYDRYKLDFQSISLRYFHRICSLIRPEQIISMTLCDGNETVGLVELFLRKFPMDSFQQLQSLTLVNIDDNEQMIRILLSITDRLRELSIENSNEVYEDTVMDILMIVIGKSSLRKLSLDMERERISNPSILWPMECFLQDIRLAGLCNLSLLRQILISSPNLRKFQAFDIDFDDEWIDENDEQELEHSPILPIVNACHLTSLSLTYARNEMEKLEWLLPQFTQLISFKYLNIYDIHIEPLYENDYSLLDGERWKKLLINCERFEFIFTIHPEADDDDDDEDDSWNIHQCFATFQTQFWKDKQWYTALEQYEKFLLIYSLPYSHHSHYYDRPKYHSLANHPFLRMQSMEFVTKLRINLPAINEVRRLSRTKSMKTLKTVLIDQIIQNFLFLFIEFRFALLSTCYSTNSRWILASSNIDRYYSFINRSNKNRKIRSFRTCSNGDFSNISFASIQIKIININQFRTR